MSSEEYVVALFTEMQCSGTSNIKISGYVNYFRNREERIKGGVSIYVRDKWANFCMKLESGTGDNEYMFLKIEAFDEYRYILGEESPDKNVSTPLG